MGFVGSFLGGKDSRTGVVINAPGGVAIGGDYAPQARDSATLYSAPGGTVNVGISLEQYQESLKRREDGLREEFAKTRAEDKERRGIIEKELSAAQNKLGHLESAYEEARKSLTIKPKL